MATETFFTMSGASPPATQDLSSSDPTEDDMPPELAQELGRLLAQALVADIRQHPKLAELKASRASTIESPPGRNRSSQPKRHRQPDKEE